MRPPRVSAQLCAGSHSLVFSADTSHVALVFDLRASRPAIAIPDCVQLPVCPSASLHHVAGLSGPPGVLGVPTDAATVAFTWHDGAECVRAFDLRQPACHAYTLSTANLSVRDLAWHEPSGSLLVLTENRHSLTHGRAAAYRYGDRLEDSEEENLHYAKGPWPPRAQFSPGYFPEPRFDLSHEYVQGDYYPILQYPFLNGRRTMGQPPPAGLRSDAAVEPPPMPGPTPSSTSPTAT